MGQAPPLRMYLSFVRWFGGVFLFSFVWRFHGEKEFWETPL